MKRIILAVVACMVATGCSDVDDELWPREAFQLDNGTIVQCRWFDQTECGVNMWDCADGHKYYCQSGAL